jgi:beta-lactamase class A
LPVGTGQVVIAVFIKESDKPMEEREKVIAEIARSVRDFYLLAEAT